MLNDFKTLYTVSELIEVLSSLPQDAAIGSYGESSLTCYPVYMVELTKDKSYAILGDHEVKEVK